MVDVIWLNTILKDVDRVEYLTCSLPSQIVELARVVDLRVDLWIVERLAVGAKLRVRPRLAHLDDLVHFALHRQRLVFVVS